MENEPLRQFLSYSGYGDGSGDGDGDGYGDGIGIGSGDGSGYGSGHGYGDGDGDGDGDGYGSGYGDGIGIGSGYGYGSGIGIGIGIGSGDGNSIGIKSINGKQIYRIDGIPCVIDHLHGSIARARILRDDLTFEPCYIVKQDGMFAHGRTLREARDALLEKLFDDMPEEDRLRSFAEAHEDGKTYPNTDFFDWHHRLTGSCEQGRREFALKHGIDVERGSMTVREFIALTERDYGGDTVRKLRAYYPETE